MITCARRNGRRSSQSNPMALALALSLAATVFAGRIQAAAAAAPAALPVDGCFGAVKLTSAGNGGDALAVGDFNGDGKPYSALSDA